MGRYLRRCERPVAMLPRFLQGESGQATVEYVIVGAALIAVIAACGSLWRFGSQGGLEKIAQSHASHAIEAQGGLVDALLY